MTALELTLGKSCAHSGLDEIAKLIEKRAAQLCVSWLKTVTNLILRKLLSADLFQVPRPFVNGLV